MNTKPCDKCGEEIRWLKDFNDKWRPTDPETTSPADQRFDANAGHMDHRNTCLAGPRKQPNRRVHKKG